MTKLNISNRLFEKLFFLLGLTAGMNCIGIYIGSSGVTLFTVVLLVLVLLGYTRKHASIKLERVKSPFFGLIFFILLSPIINFVIDVLPSTWTNRSLITLAANFVGFTSFYMLYGKSELLEFKPFFINGLKINAVIQTIWALAQFLLSRLFRISLNYAIGLYMPKVLNTNAITGLTWERAEFTLVLVFGYILFNNNLLMRILAILCITLTESRTGFIISALLIILSINYKKLFSIRKIRTSIIFISAIFIILAFVFRNQLIGILSSTYNSIIFYDSTTSGIVHSRHYLYFFSIIKKISWINVLFGFSDGCYGYP